MTTDEACNLISFMIWGDRAVLDAAAALPRERYFEEQDRGQLNSMIRRAGGTPANTMYWSFVQAGRPRG